MFDTNQDLEQAGSQSGFGQPITGGERPGLRQLPDVQRRRHGVTTPTAASAAPGLMITANRRPRRRIPTRRRRRRPVVVEPRAHQRRC